MKGKVLSFTAMHSQKILLAAMVLAFLLVGGVGEAVAHNPGGHAVPGCGNGADAAAHNNPNCHG